MTPFFLVLKAKVAGHAATWASIAGLGSIVAIFQADSTPAVVSDAAWAWRLAVTVLMTVFFTLCGVVYNNIKQSQKDQQERQEKLSSKLDRLTGVVLGLMTLLNRDNGIDAARFVEMIQKLMEN